METLNLGIGGLDDVELIGRGGSSRVYRATQVELDRPVALKVLKAGDDPNVVRRFDRERKAMGRLSLNDGIVPVYSTGITDHGEPYLIMPYYEDGSLQDRMADGPVPWIEAVGYVTEAARTMAAAHEAGVVHLDLKPANILLSSDQQPRIADFGIAKLVNETSTATTTGAAFTPTYSSPEILLGGAATAASDVYGLAATLWAMLAGRPPFRSEESEDNSLMAVVGRVVHQPIENLRHIAPDEVCAVVEKGMAKDPNDRYPTAGAFAQALNDATTSAKSRESRDVAPAPAATSEETTTGSGLLNFEDAVPPRFEPAPAPPRILATGTGFARYGMILGLVVAAGLVIAAVSIAAALLTPDDAGGGADISTVSTTVVDDGSGTSDTAPAGPFLSATTTARATTTTIPTSATTAAATTATTRSTPSTANTTVATTASTTSVTSATTSSSSTSSSSTSSSTTTSSTVVVVTLDPPTEVTAALAGDSVTVSWTPPADTTGLTGYTIVRTGGGVVGNVGAGVTSFADSTIEKGNTYTYRVRALGSPDGPDPSVLSEPSNSVTVPDEPGPTP